MLNPQVAEQRLKEFTTEKPRDVQKARLAGLPVVGRTAGYALQGWKPDGTPFVTAEDWATRSKQGDAQREAQTAAYAHVDTLSEADREKFFACFFPALAPLLAWWWQPRGANLYQGNHNRRPFRLQPGNTSPEMRQGRQQIFTMLINTATEYQEMSASWFAAWVPYINAYAADNWGKLFAAAIDRGGPDGDAVFNTLLESGRGDHEVGAMGRHVTRGLLSASRPDGWEWVEKLLLAAQRQEGLRQSVLEVIDEAHPEAFRRMLKLIRENDLFRFSATIRAADVWFGMNWVAYEKLSVKQANAATETVETFLHDPTGRDNVLATSEDGQTVYLALWSMAFDDAHAAARAAVPLLSDGLVTRRYAALHLLTELRLAELKPAILAGFDDPDLRVAQKAFGASNWYTGDGMGSSDALAVLLSGQDQALTEILESGPSPDSAFAGFLTGIKDKIAHAVGVFAAKPDADTTEPEAPAPPNDADDRFERLERNIPRFPSQPKELEPVIWEWDKQTAHQEPLADALGRVMGNRPIERILPYLPQMGSYGRAEVARQIGARKDKTPALRDALLMLVGDSASYVRETAFKALSDYKIGDEEVERIEGLLTRKAADLRKSALDLLIKRDDDKVIESGERLTGAKDANQRTAGLDLLGQMVETKRSVEKVRAVVARFTDARGEKITDPERRIVEPLLNEAHEAATLENALGLMNPAELTRADAPTAPKDVPLLVSPSVLVIIREIEARLEENKEAVVTVTNWNGDSEELLLGNVGNRFPSPDTTTPYEQIAAKFPLREMWERFWDNRPDTMRDADGMELLRVTLTAGTPSLLHAFAHLNNAPDWMKAQFEPVHAARKISEDERRNPVAYSVLLWLAHRDALTRDNDARADYLIRAAEATLSAAAKSKQDAEKDWRDNSHYQVWLTQARRHFTANLDVWTPEMRTRLYRLLFWMERPDKMFAKRLIEFDEMAQAFQDGFANVNDVYNLMLGTRIKHSQWSTEGFGILSKLTGRKVPEFEKYPQLKPLAEAARARIIEVELRRADTETAASDPALNLRYSGGMDTLLSLLGALGKDVFARGYSYYGQKNRSNVFSRLIRSAFPGEGETPEAFAAAAKKAGIGDKRLIETAVYAPQWARHIEHALALPGLTDAIWWLHAHTKDNSWSVPTEIRETWTAEISDKTPLSGEDLTEGAVDVGWFRVVYDTLSEANWKRLDDAAKYASSAGGHKRAQLFADAMLGRLDADDLMARMKDKRHQDSLRALGLVPVPDEEEAKEAELLRRYRAMQELARTSKQFGAQRQESEKLAVRIGMENLARTAGYPDPVRLTWAMEASAVADLKDGPVVYEDGDVTVSLSINGLGLPELKTVKKGKELANIPPKLKKEPEVAEMVARKTDLTRQVSRMRESLEGASCRGDRFTGKEIAGLLDHPILRPLLQNLVFIEAEGKEPVMGYPVGSGKLEDCNGKTFDLGADLVLRIAHPYDLLHTGRWEQWQRDCFLRERVQPFKQVFRELYVLTEAEKVDGTKSQRYAGHQVNPKQALALFNKRGWVGGGEYDYDSEGPRKTFHEDGFTVGVQFGGYTATPSDVEGSLIEMVRFTRKGEWKPVPLEEVPPRVFSEAMRDLDLVVSVAHVGGVDPEASQSTVEMRSSLTREAMRLLKIENVRFEKSHAIIDGKLATYNVHLGSAIVHRQPGGYLCIVPIHAQHRGRLFLPFADDDPRTAEVISKVLLLARDAEIKDPTILEQILSVR